MDLEFTQAERFEHKSFLKDLVNALPTNIFKMDVVDHAEKYRVLPSGTPRPGPLDLGYTPYLIEPLNNMSSNNVIQETVILKAAQLGFTMGAECIINYFIGEDPSDQLFISASSDTIERWASRRLEPSITSYGYRDLIQSAENRSGKRQGDKMFSKEYLGRRLDLGSAQSASGMRSTDKKVLIRDEIDGAPAKLKTGEGNFLKVSYARTNAWGNRRKVFDFSTPTTFEKSLIWKRFLEGDQRYYFVPCPHCQEKQKLEMKNLIAEKEDGQVKSAFYACKHCGEAIYEYHKLQMFKREHCEWIPTAKPISEFIRSYSINSLYSPMGMLSWLEIARKREEAYESIDPEDRMGFVNLYEGMPYKEEGSRPKLEKIIELKGIYNRKTVPDLVLYITIGIDVQRGSTTDKQNPARLELEVLGHGPGYRTFSIDYLRIEGPVDDPYSGAWEQLDQMARDGELVFRKKDGSEFRPSMTFIDSGDGSLTNVVYRFCGRWGSTFPIKGQQNISKNKGLDIARSSDVRRYKRSKIGEEAILYNISTNYYKSMIYNNLKIKRTDEEIQPPGFCDFPIEYNEKYFKMLTAEEKMEDGNFYCPDHRRNEALDARCYALCASDVYLDLQVETIKANIKKKGGTEEDIKKVTRRQIIELMKKKLNVSD